MTSNESAVAPQPLSKSNRRLVLGVAFGSLVLAGAQLGLMPLASLSVSRDLLGSAYEPGLAGDWFARYTASLMLGAALGGVVLGAAGDRFGRKRALGASVICYSIFAGLGAIVSDQTQLLVLRFLTGLGIGGVVPSAVALASECWPNVSRPLVAGITGAGINVGILLMSQLGSWRDVSADSWRWLFELSAWPAALGVATLLIVPESPAWTALRATQTASRTRTPLGTLFHPPMLRRTVIGIALSAIPLVGAWGASKWMIPWADHVAGVQSAGYKATTQAYWAVGATLGSFSGSLIANLLGRRVTYFLISLSSAVLTCGIFRYSQPLADGFLPLVFVQGFVATLFFGWLPLYLPELFPTSVRSAGIGTTDNLGRVVSALGVLAAGTLMAWSGGDYTRVGAVTGLVYALGMIVIFWAPVTTGTLDVTGADLSEGRA
ncbi:MAG TPA: MFS transporter [Pirellulales bacterium]|nr:MFS transporter [Pirellulales bacterium]